MVIKKNYKYRTVTYKIAIFSQRSNFLAKTAEKSLQYILVVGNTGAYFFACNK